MIALIVFSLLILQSSDAFSIFKSKACSVCRKSTSSDEQEIKDLNLDEMFEVFEAADKTIPASAVALPGSAAAFDPKSTVGSSSPLGFFDPAGYTVDISEDQYKLYQEAEIKHGRVAMLAFLGIVFGELFNPLFDGKITGPAIYQFQQADEIVPFFYVGVLWLIALIEGNTIIEAWQPLEETLLEPLGLAKLKKSHTPGNLKFDPLKFFPKDADAAKTIKLKELNNGRLAM
jgi:light-harvesting complex I chlorophyll a/b binding protein 1